MWRKICILDLIFWLFLEEHILKICSMNPGQVGFSLILESFFLSMFGVQIPFFFEFLQLSTQKPISRIKQKSKYLLLIAWLEIILQRWENILHICNRLVSAGWLTFTFGTCLCPRLIGVAGNDALALEQEAFSTLDRYILINIKLLFRKQSILGDDKRDRAWICCRKEKKMFMVVFLFS